MPNPLIQARDGFCARHGEARIDLNGRDWGVLDVGAGPVLVLIPGTLGRGDIFWQQIEALAGEARLIALTYPATGGIAEWAGDLGLLLDRLEVARAAVLGTSLGGYLAQYFAALYPERVTRLIAANTLASTQGVAQAEPYARDLDAEPIAALRAGFGGGLSAWAKAHPDQSGLVELLLQEVAGRIPEAELRTRLKALKNAPALPELSVPKMHRITVESADDPLIPPPMRADLRAALAPGVCYHFNHGGHFPYLARPQAYTALLRQVMGLTPAGPNWGEEKERSL